MPVIKLPDGTQGYKYPTASKTYKPTATPFCGATVFLKAQPHVVIREAAGTTGRAFYQRKDESCYWIAPVEIDGTIGPMTTQWISARDIMTRSS